MMTNSEHWFPYPCPCHGPSPLRHWEKQLQGENQGSSKIASWKMLSLSLSLWKENYSFIIECSMSSQERRPKIPFWKKMWSGGRWDSRRQTDALAPHATYKQRQWMERLPSSNYGRKEGTKGDGLCWSGHLLLACMSAKELWVLSGLGSKFWKLESKYVLGVNVAMTNQLVICLKLFSNQVSDSVMVIYIIQWPLELSQPTN